MLFEVLVMPFLKHFLTCKEENDKPMTIYIILDTQIFRQKAQYNKPIF